MMPGDAENILGSSMGLQSRGVQKTGVLDDYLKQLGQPRPAATAHHLLKRLSFLHCIFLSPLSKIRCPQVRGFISGLSILFH